MTLTRFVLPSLMLGLVLSLLPSVATAGVVSGVVYGNLGPSGTDTSGYTGSFQAITSAGAVRQVTTSFSTTAGLGSLDNRLNSLTIGVTSNGTGGPFTAKLYSGASSPTTFLAASSPAIPVPVNFVDPAITFDFSGGNPYGGFTLAPSTTYWIVLDQPGLGWLTTDTALSSFKPSMYAAGGGSKTFNGTSYVADGRNFAFSVTAVPEPSTYAMAGIGAGLLGLAKFRRRLGRSEIQG